MKLVLFDIDGTLIYHIDQTKQCGFPRFEHAIKQIYGVNVRFSVKSSYNGWVDKQIVRSIISESLFPEKEFNDRWLNMGDALFAYAERQAAGGKKLYGPIQDAVSLAILLSGDKKYRIGLLTGNVKQMAYWKLDHAGIPSIFSFGLFGDTVDNRILLAKSVFDTFRNIFHKDILPSDIIIIGDSIHDVRCGKAIGAKTIAVATGTLTGKAGIHGGSQYKKDLESEHPDLLVESLMDKSVLDYFGIKKV